MIGLSLKLCVFDIATGKVKIEDVERIITGTNAPDDEIWESVIDIYRRSYWMSDGYDPDHAEEIARKLKAEGKIVQPRTENIYHYPVYSRGAHWVNSERQIMWSDELRGC